jgi:hypothetical protein
MARFRARSNSHPVAARDGCTNIPLAAGKAQEDETILQIGCLSHAAFRFVYLDPPGLIKSWKITEFGLGVLSGGPRHGAFDDDTSGHISPEHNQQLSRQRHDHRLAQATAVAPDPILEPMGERRARLMA